MKNSCKDINLSDYENHMDWTVFITKWEKAGAIRFLQKIVV